MKEIWLNIGIWTGRVFAVLLTFVAAVAVVLLLILNMFCDGTSPAAKQVFVTTILETGQLKFLASWFLTPEEINEIVNQNSMEAMDEEVNKSLIVVAANSNKTGSKNEKGTAFVSTGTETEKAEKSEWLEIEEIHGRSFFATLMIVHDPSRVSLATIYPWKTYGVTLDVLVNDNDAIGGINGGLYKSTNNSGGSPYGVVVSGGEIQYNDPEKYKGLVLIGLTEDDILDIVDIDGMKPAEIETLVAERKIRDAVSFQEEANDKNNHFVKLVINGEAREMNGMGSGCNPRTAIGQTADGSLLLLVTNGRGIGGNLGATASDLINIMMEYGAVNAANLDGGSSSCMYYDGEYLMDSVTFYHANSSWRLPFAFIVK
ncbi:MAG: phosphodiester glycosidase family protein [Lachnospiraceae bacterium]|nr:phosphodiester glycosidase family protein [Lachnospiraceae bacterium]